MKFLLSLMYIALQWTSTVVPFVSRNGMIISKIEVEVCNVRIKLFISGSRGSLVFYVRRKLIPRIVI